MRIALDVECYIDYFMVGFLNPQNGKLVQFEKFEGCEFDAQKVMAIMRRRKTYGFNSNGYDLPMIFLACYGLSNEELKRASDMIIVGNQKPWHLEKHFDVRFPKVDHIDLIEVAPGQASLKIYGGRVHTRRMQDLPIEPDSRVLNRPTLRKGMLTYNGNDLWTTEDLYRALEPQIDLREKMSERYELDLRSKSDAQIAEAVIKSQIEQLTRKRPERPLISTSTTFRYNPPAFLKFQTPTMQALLQEVSRATFSLSKEGKVLMPKELEGRVVRIGRSAYRMGIGGLHSSEKSRAHFADDEYALIDRDVTSYYPSIILNCGLYPEHIGPIFLKVYRAIVEERIKAKAAKDSVTANCLKIVINGSFGKLGSMWSVLYAPNLMIQVTVTGQLALLMLIERLEQQGIRVVSGNTDGVVIKCRRDKEDVLARVIAGWEKDTGFGTEETRYSAVYSRDVNNYLAVLETPEKKGDRLIHTKTKGAYADPGLSKNPTCQIAVEAVVDHLVHGADIEDTILGCPDIRRFVAVRKVNGGAVKDDEYVGKSIRWYYSTATDTPITYASNGNQVPRSEGAMPLLELPDDFPDDVDYDWYIREARGILADIGAVRRVPTLGPLVTKQINALI